MSYVATVIEIFLSSPTDVNNERDFIVSFASEWNNLRSKQTGCFLSILTWENMVAPAMADRAQQVVNEQIGHTYDVYLGVMWSRLGTPTGTSASGTVEEFELALERAEAKQNVHIASLFKKAPLDIDAIDPEQLAKVKSFKQRVGALGGFYREFSDESSLRSILSLLFEQIARDKELYKSTNINEIANTIEDQLEDELEEIGLIDNSEEFVILVSNLLEKLQRIGDAEAAHGAKLQEYTDEMTAATRFGNIDQKVLKSIIKRSTDDMLKLSDYLSDITDDIEDDVVRAARLIDNDLRLKLDFENPHASANIDDLEALSDNLKESVSKIEYLIQQTNAMPRMSIDMTRAKKSLIKSRERIRDLFISLQQSIDNSIKSFMESFS